MGVTTELRRALKARLFPYLLARGFAPDLRNQPNLAVFRRRADGRVHILGLQWEKYGKPRFIIHFGTCPADGLPLKSGVCSPEDVLPTWCPDAGTLQPRRGMSTRAWFRQDSTLVQRLLGQPARRAPNEVVDELIAVFPELERYWVSGEAGPHVRLWPVRGDR